MRKLVLVALTLAFGTGFAFATDDGLPLGVAVGGQGTPREYGDGYLTTIFAQNNGFAGNSFDVTALTDLTIVGWDCNLDAGTWNIEIYTRAGTATGHEQIPSDWTLLGSVVVQGAGVDLPTHIDLGGVEMASGQMIGVIARCQEYSAFNYTNGGPNTYSNADMSITTYAGLGNNWPPSSVFPGRIWNGTVHYDYGFTPVEESTWGSIKALF